MKPYINESLETVSYIWVNFYHKFQFIYTNNISVVNCYSDTAICIDLKVQIQSQFKLFFRVSTNLS